ITKAGSEDAVRTGLRIDLPNRGASFFLVDAVLAGVAVRADRDIELAAVFAGDEILRPVMVERSAREIGDMRTVVGDPRLSGFGGVSVSATSTSPFGRT